MTSKFSRVNPQPSQPLRSQRWSSTILPGSLLKCERFSIRAYRVFYHCLTSSCYHNINTCLEVVGKLLRGITSTAHGIMKNCLSILKKLRALSKMVRITILLSTRSWRYLYRWIQIVDLNGERSTDVALNMYFIPQDYS